MNNKELQSTGLSSREGAATLPSDRLGRVAVTLQSSLLGYIAHAGFLNALVDSGIRPAKVSGASAGALAASAYASGLEGEALRDFVLDRKLQRSFREWGILFRGPSVFGLYRGSGLLSGKRVVKYLRKHLAVNRIQDTPAADLSIGVTNLTKGEKQLITEGLLAEYIVASCAISPIIRAQEIDGEYFLDGGFSDESPFEQWLDDPEIDTIIIHRIVSDARDSMEWSNYTSFLACWIVTHKLAADELMDVRLQRARAAGKQIVVHDTHVPRPKLILSPAAAEESYGCGYNQWSNSPSLVVEE